jgi:two-component system sensor histidine kinase KdpD
MVSIGRKWPTDFRWARGYVAAVALVLLAIGAGAVLRRLPHANLSLLFLLAVLIVAAVWGLWPSIFASALSFLALNFFFTAPLYTFTVEEEGDLASIIFFLAMASLTANLAARMRSEMAANEAALGRVSILLDFSRRMATAVNSEEALTACVDTLGHVTGAAATAWLPDDRNLIVPVAGGTRGKSGDGDGAAQDFWMAEIRHTQIKGRQTYIPLTTAGGRVGLVSIDSTQLNAEQRQLVAGLCEQASLAVERILLVDNLKAAQVVSETERLRSALLSSVSHDLKTPLASIIGSVSSVLEYRDILKPDDQRELLRTVLEESQRLNRYIQNLLDMTRFGADRIELHREWVDLNDLVSAALERLATRLEGFDVRVDLAPAVSLIRVHGTLIEQALVNILDNAAGFSQPGDKLDIRSYSGGDTVVIEIVDRGPGIEAGDREKVFDMFYSAQRGDRDRRGIGLGLAICKSIVDAHGGSIEALPGPDGIGTSMRITLPINPDPIGDSHA